MQQMDDWELLFGMSYYIYRRSIIVSHYVVDVFIKNNFGEIDSTYVVLKLNLVNILQVFKVRSRNADHQVAAIAQMVKPTKCIM